MPGNQIPLHYVSTWDQARDLIDAAQEFYVENCGCRQAAGQCARSRHDVCLLFRREASGSSSNPRPIPRAEAEALVDLAREKLLVARPFRDFITRSWTDGICFCCDDCCEYFRNRAEVCDKGVRIERTEWSGCTHCGVCAPACSFGARKMVDGRLEVDQTACYGCGLCQAVCPEGCIEIEER